MPSYDSTQMIRDDRDLRDVVKDIWKTAAHFGAVELPDVPAVYGILLDDATSLPALHSHELVYVGKSMRLSDRGHLKTGNTSRSTLRRTVGAVLKRQLRLRAHMRNSGLASHYCFHEAGEKRLTEWMKSNLRIGFSVVVDDVVDVERRLIRYSEPVLNLTYWPNPQAAKIQTLRIACVEEARRNGPSRRRSS